MMRAMAVDATYDIRHLEGATRITHATNRHFLQVDEWRSKHDTLVLQLDDVPRLLEAHNSRSTWPNPAQPRITMVDMTPTIRLANAIEAMANGLYSVAEIAASFANKQTRGRIPSSFNQLRKKCENGECPDVAAALGDLQWYRKVRELRTEWAHYSSIFIGESTDGAPVLCVRSYRRQTDRVEFKSQSTFCDVPQFCDWVTKALQTLNRFAGYLLTASVIPSFNLDEIITSFETEADGFPKLREDGGLFTKKETIRDYLRGRGIET
jgi:hypothetical protein